MLTSSEFLFNLPPSLHKGHRKFQCQSLTEWLVKDSPFHKQKLCINSGQHIENCMKALPSDQVQAG